MDTKSKIVVLVVAAVVIVATTFAFSGEKGASTLSESDVRSIAADTASRVAENVGGQRAGIQEFADGIKLGKDGVTEFTVSGVIEPQSNQDSYRNTSGKDEFVMLGAMYSIGTTSSATAMASSTFRWLMGSSTASTIGNYSSPTSANTALINFPVATSSNLVATTTNSVRGTGATNGAGIGVLRIRNDEYVNMAVLAGSSGTPNTLCTEDGNAGACLTATSTKRGHNVGWFLNIFRP